MHIQHLAALGPLLYSCGVAGAANHFDVLNYVDPLIGTTDGGMSYSSLLHCFDFKYSHVTGHVFPGASMPYGMAKAVADVTDEKQGGFASNDADST